MASKVRMIYMYCYCTSKIKFFLKQTCKYNCLNSDLLFYLGILKIANTLRTPHFSCRDESVHPPF